MAEVGTIRVTVHTTADQFRDWEINIEVTRNTTIAELKELLAKPPINVVVTPTQTVLKKFGKSSSALGTASDTEQVSSALVLLNYKPDGVQPEEAFSPSGLRGESKIPDDVCVTVRTTLEAFEHWELQLAVPRSTTVLEMRRLLTRPPHSLKIEQEHKVLQRLPPAGALDVAKPTDRVSHELVLLNFNPAAAPQQDAAEGRGLAAPARHYQTLLQPDAVLRFAERPHLLDLKDSHLKLEPRERRGRSWSRALSFAQALLAESDVLRSGTPDQPLEIWILNATDEVEGCLARDGYFDDANFVDRIPCNVTIWGWHLRCLGAGSLEPALDELPRVRAASYGTLASYMGPPPDLVAIFMPAFAGSLDPASAPTRHCRSTRVPHTMLGAATGAPVVLSTRYRLPDEFLQGLAQAPGRESPSREVLLAPTRCPFSGSGETCPDYDDNGWVVGLRDVETLSQLLAAELSPAHVDRTAPERKRSAIFWGIIDLKYDPSRPIFDRVKVLETGDGQSSRFSGAGADLPARFRERYGLEKGGGAAKHTAISANKKLTHDLLEAAGYGHVLPRQACFPRVYTRDLAQRIVKELGVDTDGIVVLKLSNRTRAAGVLPVRRLELDAVLKEVLVPPDDLEEWFRRKLRKGPLGILDIGYGTYEEHVRHWWSNECPFFVVERYCSSYPLDWEGKLYDGTLRVAFALRRRGCSPPGGRGPPGTAAPGECPAGTGEGCATRLPPVEELEIDWLGGYWKLPKSDVHAPQLRERIISAARTFGTLRVDSADLAEVYAALGDSVQRLFGGSEPTSRTLAERYDSDPLVGTYLVARLAVAIHDPVRFRNAMHRATTLLERLDDGPLKCCAESFISRGLGVFHLTSPPGTWPQAKTLFQKSLQLLPTNATTLYLLGIVHLQLDPDPQKALDMMSKSVLLDPDFKAPYANLGVAFLRLRMYDEAIAVSEACLDRHPDSPQCLYHIGLACYQKSFSLECYGSTAPAGAVQEQDQLRKRGLQALLEARCSEEGRRVERRGRNDVPFSEFDDRVITDLRLPRFGLRPTRAWPIDFGPHVGWKFFRSRT